MSGALTPAVRRTQAYDEVLGRRRLLHAVEDELARQDAKWGVPEAQIQTPQRRLVILVEEVGEYADAMLTSREPIADCVTELTQVAAVAVANAQRVCAGLDGAVSEAALGVDVRFAEMTRYLGTAARAWLNGDRFACAHWLDLLEYKAESVANTVSALAEDDRERHLAEMNQRALQEGTGG